MSLNVTKIRSSEKSTKEFNGLEGVELNRVEFRELDYSDPADPTYSDPDEGNFKVKTTAGTYDVDGGTVSSPRYIQLNRYLTNTSGGSNITTGLTALLFANPLLPGEELEISFYTAKSTEHLGTPESVGSADDFLAVFYQDDATQWESFCTSPTPGVYGTGTDLIGKGVVPASTSTNIGVINGGFQYSSGRSNSSFSQARNSDDSGNQTDAKLYTFNQPAAGTATSLSRFFRVTIKNNSPKPAMLKLFLVNESSSGSTYIYRNLYDLRGKLTYPAGGVVKIGKGGILGVNSGGGADHNLSIGGQQLIVSNPSLAPSRNTSANRHRALVHAEFSSLVSPVTISEHPNDSIANHIESQYFAHNHSKGSSSSREILANTEYLLSLTNSLGGEPVMLENASGTDQSWTFSHPYVFLAPRAGRISKVRFCTETPMTSVVYFRIVKYAEEFHQGKWGDSVTGMYAFSFQSTLMSNISNPNSRVFEQTFSSDSTVANFVAGDALYLIIKLPNDTHILNGYTIIDWS